MYISIQLQFAGPLASVVCLKKWSLVADNIFDNQQPTTLTEFQLHCTILQLISTHLLYGKPVYLHSSSSSSQEYSESLRRTPAAFRTSPVVLTIDKSARSSSHIIRCYSSNYIAPLNNKYQHHYTQFGSAAAAKNTPSP